MKCWKISLMLGLLFVFTLLSDTALAQGPTLDAWAIAPIGASGGNTLDVATSGPIVAYDNQNGLETIIGFAGPASQAGQSANRGVFLPILVKQ